MFIIFLFFFFNFGVYSFVFEYLYCEIEIGIRIWWGKNKFINYVKFLDVLIKCNFFVKNIKNIIL